MIGIENLAFCGNTDGNDGFGCKCEDSFNNTYACVRTLTSTQNSLFCNFADNEESKEAYDLQVDPFQLHNQVYYVDEDRSSTNFQERQQKLDFLLKCEGYQECNILKWDYNRIQFSQIDNESS